MKLPTHNKGFTLLLASLIASLVLLLGASMFELAQKEILLSSIGRDSQFAFYAADGAAECALYWDIRHARFSTSSPPANVQCDGQTAAVTTGGSWPSGFTFTFEYQPNGYCAKVVLTRKDTNPKTVIRASGYNTSCAGLAASARALERSVELRY